MEVHEPDNTTATILLAEDYPLVRAMVSEILSLDHYRIIATGDGREAYAYFAEHPGEIDLVVTDVVMPKMDGKRLGNQCRSLIPGTRILYMSGYSTNVLDPDKDLDARADFIAKPFRPAEFLSRVRRLLEIGGEARQPPRKTPVK